MSPNQAIVAHGPSGTLRTVPAADVPGLVDAGWMLVCYEPADEAHQHLPAPAAAPTYSVKIKWLHHTKAHHRDDAEQRQSKAAHSKRAHDHEGIYDVDCALPAELWTVNEIEGAIELAASMLPKWSPDSREPNHWALNAYRSAPHLQIFHLMLQGDGVNSGLWMSNIYGWSASVTLPGRLRPEAVAPLINTASPGWNLTLNLDGRKVRHRVRGA